MDNYMDNYFVQLSNGLHRINDFTEFHELNKTTCFVRRYKSIDNISYFEEIYKGSDCDILKEYFKESK